MDVYMFCMNNIFKWEISHTGGSLAMGGRCHRNDKGQPWVQWSTVHRQNLMFFPYPGNLIHYSGRKAHPEAFLFFFYFKNRASIIYKCKIPFTTKQEWTNVCKLGHSKWMRCKYIKLVHNVPQRCFTPVLKTYYNSKIFQSNGLSLFSER